MHHTLAALSPHRAYAVALIRHIYPLRRALVRFRCINDSLLDIRCQTVEGLLDVDVALGGDFHEGDAELVGQLLSFLRGDHAFLFPVAFVADEDLVDAFGGVLFDVGEPCSDICCCFSSGFGDSRHGSILLNDRSSVTS